MDDYLDVFTPGLISRTIDRLALSVVHTTSTIGAFSAGCPSIRMRHYMHISLCH
jgi:hypothetical protein